MKTLDFWRMVGPGGGYFQIGQCEGTQLRIGFGQKKKFQMVLWNDFQEMKQWIFL